MAELIGIGSISITDISDAIITTDGQPPRNPSEGTLWVDNKVLKVYQNGVWGTQRLDVSNLDPDLQETISVVVETLGNISDDGKVNFTERKKVSQELASIIGSLPSMSTGNVYTNTLPDYTTLDSTGVGSFASVRATAINATIAPDHTLYVALRTAYDELDSYVSAQTPKLWDITSTNKNTVVTLADPDRFREVFLNYYMAELRLSTEAEKQAQEAMKDYTDLAVSDVITKVDVEYAKNTSQTTAPTSGWNTTPPAWEDGSYIWSRTITNFKNGDTDITTPVNITGAKGATGDSTDGRSITNIKEQYYLSDSSTELLGDTWGDTPPAWQDGKYMWTRSIITFANPSGTQTTDPISVTGSRGEKGEQGDNAPLVKLSGDTQIIKVTENGNTTPSTSFTVTGSAVNTTISTWQYSVNGGSFSSATPTGVNRSGVTVTINPGTSTFTTLSIKVSDGTVSDTFTVARAVDGTSGDKGDPGSPGAPGADAYTVVLTNESHTFAGGTSSAIAGSTTTDIIAYKGTSRVSVTVGTISGMPTGMSRSISNNGTQSTRVTFSVSTSMTSTAGTVVIPLTVDGQSINKNFSYAIALKGTPGDKGDTGEQGTQGPKGADGQSQWVHIRYSTNSNGSSMTTTPQSNTAYIGMVTTTSSTAPTSYTSYSWTLFKGPQGNTGPQGIRGPEGADGQTTYTWVRYADDEKGNGMSQYPEGKRYVGMAFNKTTATESNSASDYKWSPLYDNVEVGGRNLAVGTSNEYQTVNPTTWYIPIYTVYADEYGLKPGDQVTLKMYIKATGTYGGRARLTMYSDDNYNNKQIATGNVISGGNEGYSELTYTLNENNKKIEICIENENSGSTSSDVEYKEVKLEKGNVATDWTPAPEDVDEKINNVASDLSSVESRVKSAELKTTDSAIVSTVRESTTYKNDLSGKVSTNEIISRINQTAESTSIDATKINLNGAVTISSFGTGLKSDFDAKASKSEALGYASSAESNAKSHANSVAGTAETNAKNHADSKANAIEGKINNAVTTIDGTGVTVKDGAFFLEDSISDTKYSIVPKDNLLKDHSFELVRIAMDGNAPIFDSYGHMLLDGSGPSIWTWGTVAGGPRLFSGLNTSVFNNPAMFGSNAIVVSGSSYVSQFTPVLPKRNQQYTLSGYFKKSLLSSGANPKFIVRALSRLGDEPGKYSSSLEFSFDYVDSIDAMVRYSRTFNISSLVSGWTNTEIESLFIEVMVTTTNSNWIMADGIQLVEGDYPVNYAPEQALFDLMNGVTGTNTMSSLNVRGNAHFNTSISVNDKIYVKGTSSGDLLWSGGLFMNGNQTIAPYKKMSECPNGWILVWSAYSGGDLKNYDWHYVVIHKSHGARHSGAGVMNVLISNSSKDNVASKYIYVSDDRLSGTDNNESGQKSYLVLREVLAW